MRRLRRILAWAHKPETQRALAILGVSLGGGTFLKFLLQDTDRRLGALEERGLVPIDDLATVGDLQKLEERLAFAGIPQVPRGGPPQEAPQVADEPPEPSHGPEAL